MLKKYVLTAAFCTTLLATAPAVAATFADTQPSTEVAVSGDQIVVPSTAVNSTEVNTIEESELTRRMIQAEKARNAKENDSHGFAITIIAMAIVIGALVILSLLFMVFGKISSRTLTRKKKEAHGVSDHNKKDHHDELDSGEVIAAIGMALAEHFGQGHDMEDTILTIRRMRKAYSPWNSKIYNLRNMPDKVDIGSSSRRPLK